MIIRELIAAISQKHYKTGIVINSPASDIQIHHFEKQVGFILPADFKEFYSICNGFHCEEDLFNMTPLKEITDYGRAYGNWFYFSEYMVYSDMWGFRLASNGQYEIYNGSYPVLSLTSSLQEFLEHFLKGNVFDIGGLYEWRDEL